MSRFSQSFFYRLGAGEVFEAYVVSGGDFVLCRVSTGGALRVPLVGGGASVDDLLSMALVFLNALLVEWTPAVSLVMEEERAADGVVRQVFVDCHGARLVPQSDADAGEYRIRFSGNESTAPDLKVRVMVVRA